MEVIQGARILLGNMYPNVNVTVEFSEIRKFKQIEQIKETSPRYTF